jgi:ketosteroid isomerase-like protein
MVVDMTDPHDPAAPARREPVAIIHAYFAAVAAGARGDALAAFYQPDAIQDELPNRLNPHGARRDVGQILAAADRGAGSVRDQRYQVLSAIADGDRVATEVSWSATLAMALGPLPEGFVMKARFAVFFELRDGRIAAQRNYDCFDPW